MIKLVEYKNFKVLRDSKLPLGRFTLIVGPNGCGKSTAMEGITACFGPPSALDGALSVGAKNGFAATDVIVHGAEEFEGQTFVRSRNPNAERLVRPEGATDKFLGLLAFLRSFATYSFSAEMIAKPVQLQPNMRFAPDGAGLAGVLDRLRDQHPERFEAINENLTQWFPEFDRILFDTHEKGYRSILLRKKEGHYSIRAEDLSQGTLLALAIMTFAYLHDLPGIIGLEEPDHGLHPRLLRDVCDALYHLAYPEGFGESRKPVQVIATTHSPYMLDLFRDHPDEIVIASKVGDNVKFERLSDHPNLEEILADSHLGDLWYSGILGGVPEHS